MIGKPGPLQTPPGPDTDDRGLPRDRRRVLGCLALVVALGLLFIIWAGGWWNRRQSGGQLERARLYHERREAEERLRRSVSTTGAGYRPGGTAGTAEGRAGELLARRTRELHDAGDWAGVIQCAGLLDGPPASDPLIGRLLEGALFNRALELLGEGRADTALEHLDRLLALRPADVEAVDLRNVALHMREFGLERTGREALEKFSERH